MSLQRSAPILLALTAFLSFSGACRRQVEVEAGPAPTRSVEGSQVFDHSGLDSVLERFVNDEGMVDYAGLKRERAELDDYVAGLAAASPRSHPELFPTREHEIAYWINAYNALMLRAVADAYPVESPLDIMAAHGVFRRLSFPVGGTPMTLDDIEKGTLFEEYGEPRVHFALSCASLSCPRLDRVAFAAEDLDERLDEEGREFLGSSRGVEIDLEGNRLVLSKYFDWYRDDFAPDPLTYVRPYLEGEKRERLDRLQDPEIEHMDYDWRLNDAGASWAPR